jgi:hypothetical protein
VAITYTNAQTYVSRILGASGDTVQLAAAADAILAAIQAWNLQHDFSFLLMDTSNGFSVASSTIAVDTITVTTSVANGFAGVNVGQTVTGTGVSADTTVESITSTTVIVLSQAATPATVTLTFSADIPMIGGTDTYNLPTPFGRPYSARLLANDRSLEFKEQREIDRSFWTQSNAQIPAYYNLFNTSSFTTGRQNGKIRLFPTPSGSDTLRVRYYRPIAEPSAGSDNLDVPDVYVYALLEFARYVYLKDHDAESIRMQETKESAYRQLAQVMARDEQGTEDKDMALIPQMEHAPWRNLDSSDINLVI